MIKEKPKIKEQLTEKRESREEHDKREHAQIAHEAKAIYTKAKENLLLRGINLESFENDGIPQIVQENVHIQIDCGLIQNEKELIDVLTSELIRFNSQKNKLNLAARFKEKFKKQKRPVMYEVQ